MKIEDQSLKHRFLSPESHLNFPQKINIHFLLRGDLHNLAVRTNSIVQRSTTSEIDFSPFSFQVPHITIYMGFVHSLENLKKIMSITDEFSKNINQFEITLEHPYLAKPKKNWIFIDISEIEIFMKLKKQFKRSVENIMDPLKWDVSTQHPHITVGYIKSNFEKVESDIKSVSTHGKYFLSAIGLSFAGARGTCLGNVRTYELL